MNDLDRFFGQFDAAEVSPTLERRLRPPSGAFRWEWLLPIAASLAMAWCLAGAERAGQRVVPRSGPGFGGPPPSDFVERVPHRSSRLESPSSLSTTVKRKGPGI